MYYDFHVPGTNNYWAEGLFHHNTGKTQLCDAIGTARKHVRGVGNFSGLHSGFQTDAEAKQDHSLISMIKDMTLVVKDGDTVLKSPNKDKILSQIRDAYDMNCAVAYGNQVKREYTGHRFTFVMAGTEAMLEMDAAEFGARFLTVTIMREIDPGYESEINRRGFLSVYNNRETVANGRADTHDDPALSLAKAMTGGYVEHLRRDAAQVRAAVVLDGDVLDDVIRKVDAWARCVAHLRARPSKTQAEATTREMSARLNKQLGKLAICLAAVMNRPTVDAEVLRRVRRVTLDTCRGRTYDLCHHLYAAGAEGMELSTLALRTHHPEDQERRLLRFMRRIKAVDLVLVKQDGRNRQRWILTEQFREVFSILEEEVT